MNIRCLIFPIAIIIIFFTFFQFAYAQTYPGDYTNMIVSPNNVRINTVSASIKFTFYKPELVRVDYLPTPSSIPDSSFVVVQDTIDPVFPTISEDETTVTLSTSKLNIVCNKFPVRFSYYSASSSLLLEEPGSGGLSWDENERKATFTLQADEHFYGTGQRGTQLDKRGRAFDSYNVAIGGYSTSLPMMNANIPFLASSGGYGLYFDNTYRGRFDLGNSSSTKFSYTAYGGELTYYFIAGETIPEQLELYTWLTGRQPMPPKWALGFIQSKYGYQNETEARSMVQTMRQKQIPCDAIILDLYWFNHMGDISWKASAWPQPFQMMSDFLSQGIKTIVITEPYIIQPSINYNEAGGLGYLGKTSSGQPYALTNWWSCNGCSSYLLDITNPAAQQWWWEKHPAFFGNELAGLWTDLGEPERHPDSMRHYLGKTPKVHNIYNLIWAKTVFDGFNQLRPNQRFFNLTRSGFAGIQRYGVSIWSGDVSRTFGGLAVQLPMLLNMGMSGIGYHNSDIGGFCCGTTTPELYVRWMQYGAFCPIMRAHGVDQPTEPWGYGEEAETISKKFIELRYQLLPYIYTMAYENHKSGMPLARPLFFIDPADANLKNESSSYLWGNSFLVSPVVTQGQTTKSLYLPEGNWIDFWTDAKIAGHQTITVPTPLDRLPIYIKAGSVIPMQFVMNYTDEHPLDTMRLVCYPSSDNEGRFTMYEDDGKTLEYQSGSSSTTELMQSVDISGSDTTFALNIGKTVGTYTGKPTQRVYLSEIHTIAEKPMVIRCNNSLMNEQLSYEALRQSGEGFFYDTLKNLLYIQTLTLPDSAYEIIVEDIHLLGALEQVYQVPSKTFQLEQNYPNPFNPNTVIRYQLSVNSHVNLKIYNTLGDEIITLINEKKSPGNYELNWDATGISSGVYYCKLTTENDTEIRKMVLAR